MEHTGHTHNPATTNPFEHADDGSDTTAAGPEAAVVLNVGRNATLTLGTDALIVLDEGLKHQRAPGNLCGLLPQFSKTTRAVPFYNVLWAELDSFEVVIHYAQPTGKEGCRLECICYTVMDKTLHGYTKTWVDALMDRAYPSNTKRRKRMKVLINPFGGQGNAQRLWAREVEPIFAAAHCEVDVERTAYKGHAMEIAEKLDMEAVDVVACASGDGLPYEVFNGLAKQAEPRRALRKVAVAQIPCGSGNAMAVNLYGTDSPSLAAVAIVKGVRSALDLTAITQGTNTYYSFLSQAVGIVAESDLGTESLRWMGGFRFKWGVLVRLLGKTIYPAELSVVVDSDDKRAIRETYRHAIDAHQAASAKHLPTSPPSTSSSFDLTLPATSPSTLPPLTYGTISDPLPPCFQTQDLPTLGNFFVGNMCLMSSDARFFVTALPTDGRLDMINIDGSIPRTTALRMLSTIEQGTLMNFPEVSYRKVMAYRITPRMHATPPGRRWRAGIGRWLGGAGGQREGLISIDGERVPFEAYQAEVVQGLGTVLSKRGAVYEFELPKSP
ncbi:sphinganine kinase lcb4 [Friedmanniomyces endolithicus]|nr:sphinganine kinase lcb4 [Friedmanniomyces endolithicus]KAK0859419.1 sphinganine kinase lcb4 [Friedmanniomyces endolithicus]KAK0868444.1 sphinganine kinase lcb4 [Friedmanniomyces endolithicus]KAK0889174.1 sphinganine kinase lcb4 [Friedmanniomyces endolithicus]